MNQGTYHPVRRKEEVWEVQNVHKNDMISIWAVSGSVTSALALGSRSFDVSPDFLMQSLISFLVEPVSEGVAMHGAKASIREHGYAMGASQLIEGRLANGIESSWPLLR